MVGILVLSVDRMLADRVSRAMGGRMAVDLVQSLEPQMLDRPSVIIIDRAAIPPERSLAAAIGTVAESAPGRPIVLAMDEADPAQILAAVRAGAQDIIRREAEGAEVAEVLSRLLNNTLAEQAGTGHLTLVIGPDHEAAALVATDLAIAISKARTPGLLIDCTLPTSAAEAYLDLKVSYGLASAVADIERLDANLLSNALVRHAPSGLQLLTFDGGTGGEPVGISPNDIAGLVRLMHACSGDIVLNAGSLRHTGLLRELATMADRIDLVCAQSIRELEASRRLLEKIAPDPLTLGRIRLLMWDHQPGVLLDGRRMTRTLGLNPAHYIGIPVDHTRIRNALNSGRPLAMEDDGGPYITAIQRAADIAVQPPKGPRESVARMRRAILRALERAA